MSLWIQFSAAYIILLLLLSFPIASGLSTDGLTLLAFKSAISLDPTRTLSSWSESDPSPCSWPGVACSSGLVTALSLPSRFLHGYLPSELSLLSSLQTLDLSNNFLTGRIPDQISNLTALSHLDLSSNLFNGSLPPSIAALPNLSGVLNLSFNFFSGPIPADYGHIPLPVSLDLRRNHLSGEIPQIGSLLNQGPTAFAGNPDLCGFPLKIPCSNSKPNPSSYHDLLEPHAGSPALQPAEHARRRAAPALTVTILAAIIFAALVSTIVLQWQFRKKRGGGEGRKKKDKEKEKEKEKEGDVTTLEERREGRTGEIYVTVDEGFDLELEELLRASAYVVGKSKSGIVYKVVVGRGLAVAVRRLSEADEGGGEGDEWRKRRAFESEAMAIGRANHPNVARLRAYYYAPDEKLLIYDYIPNGTLHSALHGGTVNPTAQPFHWAKRLTIIQDAARGLAYLHECSPRKYIHGNIKTSKILLDDDLHPYISGFGLTRLLSGTQKLTHSLSLSKKMGATTSSQYMAGVSTEYLSPEARAPGTPVTQKCDIYAFGVVLLEVLTGKMAGGRPENGQEELEGFVRRAFKEERPLSELVDPALLHEVHAKKQVLAVFHVALGCTELDPELRPRMRAVSESLDRVGSS